MANNKTTDAGDSEKRPLADVVYNSGDQPRRPAESRPSDSTEQSHAHAEATSRFVEHEVSGADDVAIRRAEAFELLARLLARHILAIVQQEDRKKAA